MPLTKKGYRFQVLSATLHAKEIEITIILTTSTGGSPRRPLHGFVNDLYIKCVKSVLFMFILTVGISKRLTKFETVSRRDLYN